MTETFLKDFWRALRKHRKRGNIAIPPLGIVKSWRMAQCARFIRRGCDRRYAPRYILRAFKGPPYVLGLVFATLLATTPALAQSTIDNFSPVPNFPLPDPALVLQNLWITQNGISYNITPTRLGYIFQGTLPPQFPFTNELWWDTTTTPATLKAFQSNVWALFPPLSAFAPLNSPTFTGIPTAPTAAPGTNTNQIATTAFVTTAIRTVITTPLTLYAGPSASDFNNDCTNIANPCSPQNAINMSEDSYDLKGSGSIVVQFLDGAYSISSLVVTGNPPGSGIGTLTLQGNNSTPDNVSLTCSASCLKVGLQGEVSITGMKLASAANGIYVHDFGAVNYGAIDFGAATFQHVFAAENGIAQAISNYTISGSAITHWKATNHGMILGFPATQPAPAPFPTVIINLVGTPAFSTAFAHSNDGSLIRAGNSVFTGSGASGARYLVDMGSVIDVNGGGANFLPGSIAGTADSATYGAYR